MMTPWLNVGSQSTSAPPPAGLRGFIPVVRGPPRTLRRTTASRKFTEDRCHRHSQLPVWATWLSSTARWRRRTRIIRCRAYGLLDQRKR
jgi:hypothetical protein